MSAAQTVTATFALQSFSLTVSKTGAGTGTVTSAPAGIACGTTCSATFASGTAVTLTATPAAGSTFTGWSGSCAGTGTCSVTMSAAQAVTASFTSVTGVSGITPSTIDLASPPATFTITGSGFANLGFGLPVVNFMSGTTLVAQARATALAGNTTLTVPFPTPATSLTPNLPGLSRGTVQAQVWQQTSATPAFSLLGSATLTVADSRGVTGISPSTIDLASPPPTFTITGNGFANLGFGLPVVNFMGGTTLVAQARATALAGSTTLTVPFPTQATSLTPNLPGLSAGTVQAQVWQQTSATPTFSLLGSATLTVTGSGGFTDNPLVAGSTVEKAVHISEVRTAVNAARTRNGLAASAWTDPTITAGSTTIRAVYIVELRTALNQVYTKLGRTLPTYTDPTLTAGMMCKAAHIQELRNAVSSLP